MWILSSSLTVSSVLFAPGKSEMVKVSGKVPLEWRFLILGHE
jgi:hypothetical protein